VAVHHALRLGLRDVPLCWKNRLCHQAVTGREIHVGYSTVVYAVDLGVLRSAIGSQDMDLVERLRNLECDDPVDPTKGPRVKVAANSDIFLNGRLVTWEEFKVAIVDPKWSGMNLYLFQEHGECPVKGE